MLDDLKEKKSLLKQCEVQLDHFENINKLRDDLVYALESENQSNKLRITKLKLKINDYKMEREAKRERRKSKKEKS